MKIRPVDQPILEGCFLNSREKFFLETFSNHHAAQKSLGPRRNRFFFSGVNCTVWTVFRVSDLIDGGKSLLKLDLAT